MKLADRWREFEIGDVITGMDDKEYVITKIMTSTLIAGGKIFGTNNRYLRIKSISRKGVEYYKRQRGGKQ